MATILKGDCLEVMKSLPDKSVDCFICDLPYGQLDSGRSDESIKKYNRGAFVGGTASKGCAWDVKIDLAAFWIQVKRLCKDDHTPVLMFCNTKFGYDLIESNKAWFRYDLVWDKGHGISFLLANKMPMKSHEMVYVFSKKGAFYRRVDVVGDFKSSTGGRDTGKGKPNRQYGIESGRNVIDNTGKRCPLSVIPVGGKSAGGHPTEKPMELYEWLLRRYVPDNGVVLDPTAGSFNAVLTARRLGYKATGIEKDLSFFWKGVAKLNAFNL
jgi:site-specific DNA-methyltransferase (adenine-specific)